MSALHPAVRLGGGILALLTCLGFPTLGLVAIALFLMAALTWTGMGPLRQLAALKPWAPVALLVIVIHTFTTTVAAPLGHPSLEGFLAGGKALLRVVCSVGCLGLYLRISPLDDLVLGVSWWLRPARRLGLRTDDLGLMLAVAMGTVPVVLGEGRRIEAVVTMRKSVPAGHEVHAGPKGITGFFHGMLGRARVVVPLLETLARRAEALTLSLRHRRPDPVTAAKVPILQMAPLVVWAAGLIMLEVVR